MKSPGRTRLKLTGEQIEFCRLYVRTGNQAEAFRAVWPEVKHPGSGANKLLKKEPIRRYLACVIDKAQEKSAERSAEELVLATESADARLAELVNARRLTRGELLTRMVRNLELPGVENTVQVDENGNPNEVSVRSEEYTSTLGEGAPIEDSDLLKTIDLVYKRLGSYPQNGTQPTQQTFITHLYRPQWLKRIEEAKQPAALEAGTPEEGNPS